jgi:hypothetical protein
VLVRYRTQAICWGRYASPPEVRQADRRRDYPAVMAISLQIRCQKTAKFQLSRTLAYLKRMLSPC